MNLLEIGLRPKTDKLVRYGKEVAFGSQKMRDKLLFSKGIDGTTFSFR